MPLVIYPSLQQYASTAYKNPAVESMVYNRIGWLRNPNASPGKRLQTVTSPGLSSDCEYHIMIKYFYAQTLAESVEISKVILLDTEPLRTPVK